MGYIFSGAILHDDVDVSIVLVRFNIVANVRVVQLLEDFKLVRHRRFHFLVESVQVQNFDGELDIRVFSRFCEIDFTEGSSSK